MIELKDLLEENETLVTFHLCNEYWSRDAITVKGSDDISGALELTLHRILEAGGTENDVKRIMGAEIPTEDELKDSLSYLKIKLEMANGGSLTPDIFFNRLQTSLKNGSKIERNEELIAYQTIKDELNISKK